MSKAQSQQPSDQPSASRGLFTAALPSPQELLPFAQVLVPVHSLGISTGSGPSPVDAEAAVESALEVFRGVNSMQAERAMHNVSFVRCRTPP